MTRAEYVAHSLAAFNAREAPLGVWQDEAAMAQLIGRRIEQAVRQADALERAGLAPWAERRATVYELAQPTLGAVARVRVTDSAAVDDGA